MCIYIFIGILVLYVFIKQQRHLNYVIVLRCIVCGMDFQKVHLILNVIRLNVISVDKHIKSDFWKQVLKYSHYVT